MEKEYQQTGLPVLQNHIFKGKEDIMNCGMHRGGETTRRCSENC